MKFVKKFTCFDFNSIAIQFNCCKKFNILGITSFRMIAAPIHCPNWLADLALAHISRTKSRILLVISKTFWCDWDSSPFCNHGPLIKICRHCPVKCLRWWDILRGDPFSCYLLPYIPLWYLAPSSDVRAQGLQVKCSSTSCALLDTLALY